MTPDELDEMAKLAEAATPGPWAKMCLFGSSDLPVAIVGKDDKQFLEIGKESTFSVGDIDFIAACRDFVPTAIAEIRRLQDDLEEEREVVGGMTVGREWLREECAKRGEEIERYRGILTKWLKAYDACGGDNGPSMVEGDCAELARAALSESQGAGCGEKPE